MNLSVKLSKIRHVGKKKSVHTSNRTEKVNQTLNNAVFQLFKS